MDEVDYDWRQAHQLPIVAIPWEDKVKYIQTTGGGAALNSTGMSFLLFDIARGPDEDERSGDVICYDRLDVNWSVLNDTTATINIWRVMLIWDKYPNGSLITAAEIWDTASAYDSFPDYENSSRYIILKDIRGWTAGSGASAAHAERGTFSLDLRGLYTRYFSANPQGDIAATKAGALIVCGGGTAPSGTTDATVSFAGRLWYRDGYIPAQRP